MRTVKTIAPVNIALIKYWGKASLNPVRPSTPSISLTLDAFYTETKVQAHPGFSFNLNQQPVAPDILEKTARFIRLFQPEGPINLAIDSINHVPTAAGLASSASGFAALSLALHHFYEKPLDHLEMITAQGSGSAVRSLKGGAVIWDTDGQIKTLDIDLSSYQMAVLMVDTSPKKIPSRAAMKSVQGTREYEGFIRRNTDRAWGMREALLAADFKKVGTLMEESTLDMHSLGAFVTPPFVYLKAQTFALWQQLLKARQQGLNAYATADAGPNLKILFERTQQTAVLAFLKSLNTPYVITDITPKGARVWSA